MNLFLIAAIVSKINIATISITLLGAVINFIITPVVAQWTIIYLEMRVLNDIDIANDYSYNFDLEQLPKLDYTEIVQYLNNEGYKVKDYCQV